jgi:hypothetical protein
VSVHLKKEVETISERWWLLKKKTETMNEVQKNSRPTPKILATSNEFRLFENELW